MYKKGAGNDKQGKDAGNRTLCPYRNFSQAIIVTSDVFGIPYCFVNVKQRWLNVCDQYDVISFVSKLLKKKRGSEESLPCAKIVVLKERRQHLTFLGSKMKCK